MPMLLWPAAASAAKLKFETAIRIRLMSTERFMPSRAYSDAADEDADQQRDEADADVVERDLVVGEAEVVEQQPQRQVGERVADLVDQHEDQHDQRALAPEELGERAEVGDHRLDHARAAARAGRWRAGSPITTPTSIAGSAKSAQAI